MRALTEQNINRGIDILTEAEYRTVPKSTTTLYIIGTIHTVDDNTATPAIVAGTVTVTAVYVGTVEQDVLLNNDGHVVWMKDSLIIPDTTPEDTDNVTPSFVNEAISLIELV